MSSVLHTPQARPVCCCPSCTSPRCPNLLSLIRNEGSNTVLCCIPLIGNEGSDTVRGSHSKLHMPKRHPEVYMPNSMEAALSTSPFAACRAPTAISLLNPSPTNCCTSASLTTPPAAAVAVARAAPPPAAAPDTGVVSMGGAAASAGAAAPVFCPDAAVPPCGAVAAVPASPAPAAAPDGPAPPLLSLRAALTFSSACCFDTCE